MRIPNQAYNYYDAHALSRIFRLEHHLETLVACWLQKVCARITASVEPVLEILARFVFPKPSGPIGTE